MSSVPDRTFDSVQPGFGHVPVRSGQMNTQLNDAKVRLRQHVRERLEALTFADRAAAAARLCACLPQQRVWREAQTILLFFPLPDEPDIGPLLGAVLSAGKTLALPRYANSEQKYEAAAVKDLGSDLVSGQFGIREPGVSCPQIPLNRLDLVLVPGVAFDARGRRLGRGKGFYDRLLTAASGTKCGVAFDEQIVDAVPIGPLDVTVNCILTPTRWMET